MDADIAKMYGNKVRVRACGICWSGDRLLMVNHRGITDTNFWAPPGGGVEFGESIEDCLIKEFLEETGLIITPGRFIFGCEFIQSPIHSIELFYDIQIAGGRLRTGEDPEIQIIEDVKFMSQEEITAIPSGEIHGIFRLIDRAADLKTLNGFFRI